MIGWIMNNATKEIPAQRVISSKGELTGSWAFEHKDRMHELLEAEGVTVTNEKFVDLKKYGWDPSTELSREELKRILATASDISVNVSPRLLYLMRTDLASPLKGR
jgi:methylated-DNA-protein-cysteine methyltransferase-like protein